MKNFQEFLEEHGRIDRTNKIERYRQLNQYVKKGQILFAGSSLAEQFPIHEFVSELPTSTLIYNRGVSGEVMHGFRQNLQVLVYDLEPSKLFINIGTNDMNMPNFQEEAHLVGYEALLKEIQEQLPETKIYLLSYYPVNPNKESFIPKEQVAQMLKTRNNQAIVHINQQLELLASRLDITYIDVHHCLLDSCGQLEESLTIEGMHLWPEAYYKVFQVLKPYF